MDKKEFIKLIRELQKLQLKIIDKKRLSIDLFTGNVSSCNYVSFALFVYNIDGDNDIIGDSIKAAYYKTIYSTDDYTKGYGILQEIQKNVKEAQLLYGGRKRSEAERSDAPIK